MESAEKDKTATITVFLYCSIAFVMVTVFYAGGFLVHQVFLSDKSNLIGFFCLTVNLAFCAILRGQFKYPKRSN